MAGLGAGSAPTAVLMVTIGVQGPGRAGLPLGHPRRHQPGAVTPLLIPAAHPVPIGLLSLLSTLSRTLPGALLFPSAWVAPWVAPWVQAWAAGVPVKVHHSVRVVGDRGDLQAHGLLVHGRAGGVEAHAHRVTGLVGRPEAGAAMRRGRAGRHARQAQPPQAPTPLRPEVLSRRVPATATRLLRRATPAPPARATHLRLPMLRPRMSLLVRPVLLLS